MGILSFIPVIGRIVDRGMKIIDDLVPDKDLAAKLKTELRQQIMVQDHEENMASIQGQIDIILMEAKGGWLQKNWRPLLMLVIIFIIANNYVIAPYIGLFFPDKSLILELPGGLWALLNVGVGGYVAGRTAEKILKKD